jgi:hypothetical protein
VRVDDVVGNVSAMSYRGRPRCNHDHPHDHYTPRKLHVVVMKSAAALLGGRCGGMLGMTPASGSCAIQAATGARATAWSPGASLYTRKRHSPARDSGCSSARKRG